MTRLRTLYGTDEPLPEERHLKAGPLEAIFTAGALRGIRLRGVEVIRGIYFLIRDRNWATVVPEIRDLVVDERGDGFSIRFAAHGSTPSDGQTLVWHGSIEASARTGIRFAASATPEVEFTTCRTGFIVLHPLERVAGCPVTVEHTDGRSVETRFPDRVDPICSFTDIRALTHEPVPGIKATCRMEGGAWETEDHRNWLDASFKTYFRPLMLPWPYTVPAGERIEQTIALTFSPSIEALKPVARQAETLVAVGDRTGLSMPCVGLAVTPAELDASLAVAGLVRDAGAQTLSIRVQTDTTDLPGVLRKASQLAAALNASPVLEVVVAARAAPAEELDLVAVAAASAGLVPSAVVVSPAVDLKSYPPSVDRPLGPTLASVYAAAREAFPGVPLGGGMFSYFTELNRRRIPAHLVDFVQHASAAIVHAADDRSVMETLEALPHVFRSVRAFAGGKPYRVGPANIAMGFNPYGASTTPNPDHLKRTMVTDDPRQTALFAAAWAAGYLARAALGGLDTVTLMAPAGPFGIADGDRPRPAFQVLRAFAELSGAAVLQVATSDPQSVLAVGAAKDGRNVVIVANLTGESRPVRIAGFEGSFVEVMDENVGGQFAVPDVGPLVLRPYAVARLVA